VTDAPFALLIRAGQGPDPGPKRSVLRGLITRAVKGMGALYPKTASRKSVDIQIEPERLCDAAALDLIICRDWSDALNQTSTEVSVLPRWVESPGPVIAGGMTAGPVAARENRSLTSAGIHKCRSWVAAAAEER
jgi:hypothetical protein